MRKQPDKDAWDLLAERTQRASRLCGSTTWNDIRIVTIRTGIKLTPSMLRITASLFLFICGVVIIFLTVTRTNSPIAGSILALLPLFLAFSSLNYISSISWKTDSNDILITYDFGPFHKKLKLNRNQLAARLDICTQEIADTSIRKGAIKLCLERTDCAKQQVTIAISQNGTKLKKAFEKLNEYLGEQCADNTLRGITMAHGQQLLIPVYKEYEPGYIGRIGREVIIISNDTMILKRNWGDTIILLLGTGLFIFLSIGCYFVFKNEQTWSVRFWITEIIFPLFGFCLFIWFSYLLIQFYLSWYLIADKNINALLLNGIITGIKKPSLVCNLSAIGALQLCSFIEPGKYSDTIYYRLHAVLNDPLGKRLVMFNNTDREQITEKAKILAKFLNVPLFDHIIATD